MYECPDVGDCNVEMAQKFVHLVVYFTCQNEEPQETLFRTETSNRSYFPVLQLILSPDISCRVPLTL